MKSLLIMRPIEFTSIGGNSGGAGADNLLTPDPKEAWVTTNVAEAAIRFNYASGQMIDTAFLGYSDLPHGTRVRFFTSTTVDATADTLLGTFIVDNPANDSRRRHAFVRADAPVANVRQIIVRADQFGSRVSTIGVVAAGLALSPYWGHEYGAGRFVIDTGNRERLFGGGFGINRGARVGGYQWTFGELEDAEVDALFRLALDAGETGSTLVIENPDTIEAGLNERIHWGLLRIEAYERFAKGATRWGMRVEDWG